ncbi:oligosaccharyl transferase subunit OST3/OST6 family [Pluteus cervinus]|uniref:Oligosaccharyl transferase subunit OST3/OST6 family n=1 Tax=Pluteus cervinus TaxID=181527 RepID=A0ACD3BEV8_9AGAR|nr:oligosaccharyl transferase subunit OST3/OST6 family [Pluteus cervinus]
MPSRLALLYALLLVPFSLALTTHERLVNLAAAGNGVIKLDTYTFDLLTAPKRNWTAAIHFTALDPRRRCAPCAEFNPAWQAVAKAWSTVDQAHKDNHFFGTIDFDDGQAVFQKLSLASAPVVYVYPATEGSRAPASGKSAPFKYDFSSGFEAGPLAEQLSPHTPIPIPYRDPINWGRVISSGFIGLGVLAAIKFASPLLKSRWAWAAGCLVTTLVMTSGLMFTRIRASPYTGRDGGWIAAGFQNQFGQEVHVVAVVYGLLAFAFTMLTLVVPLQRSPQRQRIQVYLWTTVIMIVYSMLVSLFRVKNRGYPFKLFL